MICMQDNNQSANKEYRSIFKATSLFGGVQVYQILINIIKSKVIAILLGPTGVGIQGLFVAAIDLIKQLASFGLAQSAVRDVSEANNKSDHEKVGRIVSIVRKLVWGTGILGLLAMSLFSPLLSYSSFGSYDYIISFIFLSTILLVDQICAGQKVVLQGLRRLKDLAKASAYGATCGLLICIPLYYILGIEGIVPTLILNSIVALLISWYFSRKISIQKISIPLKSAIKEAHVMIKLGLALSVSSILVSACAYILRGYIRSEGGTELVGLFTAGFVIMNTYVSMVFNALGTDFFPRLSAVNHDNVKCREMVNQQAEIGLLILAPILSVCMVFTQLIIIVLYSSDFASANDYISWAAVGMLFKLLSWCISYQFIAKGESRVFIINEVLQNTYTLLLNLLGFHFCGLTGLGMSFTMCQILYLIQVYIIAHYKYGYFISSAVWKIFIVHFVLVSLAFVIAQSLHGLLLYGFGTVLIVLSCMISLYGLEKRTNLMQKIFKRG